MRIGCARQWSGPPWGGAEQRGGAGGHERLVLTARDCAGRLRAGEIVVIERDAVRRLR